MRLFREYEDIELLVTDQAMPNMTGVDLISAIDEMRPGVAVVIASGYGEGIETEDRFVLRLGKPFNQAQLARAVVNAIDEP